MAAREWALDFSENLGTMTVDKMAGRGLGHSCCLEGTFRPSGFAAGMETASPRRIEGAGHLPLEENMFPLSLHGRIGDRNRREQSTRIGMKRVVV